MSMQHTHPAEEAETRAGSDNDAPRISTWRIAVAWVVGILALIVIAVASVFMGTASLTVPEVLGTFGLGGYEAPSLLRQSILLELRIPRILMAIVVGAALAVAGACLQTVTRNALAEPYLLGISGGSSVGAVAVIVLGISGAIGVTGGAMIGGLAAFGLLMILLRGSGFQSARVVLTGVLVGQFSQAIMYMLMFAKGDADAIQSITAWLLGALGTSRWDQLALTAPVCAVAVIILWALSRYLDVLSLGDDTAESMGVPVVWTRAAVLVIVALLTASTVAAVGAIGFVGLIVPHAVRMLVGSAHRHVIPLAALVGGILLVLADAVARILFDAQELPVGVITALIGVPVFFVILRRGQRAKGRAA
ncbi:Iron(III) dicitrate transport system permease fecD [Corynebacterium renale]|uniref:Iron complex transport system permease protein n=2 Tax=Corynebacterium renale TaxID=1724 RepID=A0A2A9DPH3_9CORY|nr:iron ABC transporter permease [Corynebacterium renale]PFG27882.1 iron complex transport system permease protein [Corynebacterium renale]SQG63398.1 Iron(III) dicitrate transport system permease fecD [Corynebacterium renale]SQI21928.1 Iron(III) dicitrate transport system permease fecD [Corynebacterium renale]STC99924.1 Iron(III) dicitrate transport system permease fecD [Corynebacterium renale]